MPRRLVFVGDNAIEDSVFDAFLQRTDGARGREAEGTHDFLARDGGLEIPHAVFLFYLSEFRADEAEVLEEAADFVGVLARDVGLAEEHQVVDVVARIEEEAADGRVGNALISKNYRAHVEAHHLLHVFHLLVHREFHAAEDGGYHLLPDEVMAVEGPSEARVETLGGRLADIVEDGAPAEPEVVRRATQLVEYQQGMGKVVFVADALDHLHTLQGTEFGENQREEARLV